MPRQLTEQQFNDILERVIASAPAGLSESQFDALVDAEAAKAAGYEPETMRPMASHGAEPEAEGSSRLATAGGMIGSLAGGSKASPVGMALAGLGGAAGQGVSEIADAAQRPLVERVSSGREALEKANAPLVRMLTAGAEQAGMEGIGRGVMGGLSAGARRLYTSLLKPSKAITRESPELVATLLKERATISPSGLAKTEARAGTSREAADALINAASPTAAPVRAKEIVPEFADTIAELRKRIDIGQPSALSEVGERGRGLMRADDPAGTALAEALKQEPTITATQARRFREAGIEPGRTREHAERIAQLTKTAAQAPKGFPLTRAQALKRAAQDSASAGYRQAERGTIKEVGASTMLDKDVARGLRKAIEKRVPDVAPINRRTQSLGSGARALRDAIERESKTMPIGARELIGAGVGGVLGESPEGAAGGALAMRLLARPRSGSAIAIGANELSRIPYSQLLRLLEQAVQEQDE